MRAREGAGAHRRAHWTLVLPMFDAHVVHILAILAVGEHRRAQARAGASRPAHACGHTRVRAGAQACSCSPSVPLASRQRRTCAKSCHLPHHFAGARRREAALTAHYTQFVRPNLYLCLLFTPTHGIFAARRWAESVVRSHAERDARRTVVVWLGAPRAAHPSPTRRRQFVHGAAHGD